MIDPTLPTAYGPIPGPPVNPDYRVPGNCYCPDCVRIRAARPQVPEAFEPPAIQGGAALRAAAELHNQLEVDPGASLALPDDYDPGNDLADVQAVIDQLPILDKEIAAFERIQQHIVNLQNPEH